MAYHTTLDSFILHEFKCVLTISISNSHNKNCRVDTQKPQSTELLEQGKNVVFVLLLHHFFNCQALQTKRQDRTVCGALALQPQTLKNQTTTSDCRLVVSISQASIFCSPLLTSIYHFCHPPTVPCPSYIVRIAFDFMQVCRPRQWVALPVHLGWIHVAMDSAPAMIYSNNKLKQKIIYTTNDSGILSTNYNISYHNKQCFPALSWYHHSPHLQISGVVEAIELPHSLLQFRGCLKIAETLMSTPELFGQNMGRWVKRWRYK